MRAAQSPTARAAQTLGLVPGMPLHILAIASVAALPLVIIAWVVLFHPNAQWLTPGGTYFGCDFVNFWSGGRIATLALGTPGLATAAYETNAYRGLLLEWFAPGRSFVNFSYPPSLMPWLMPFAQLPYGVALALWSALGIGAFFAAMLDRWPARSDAPWLIALALSPVLISNLLFGQIALFAAAAFMAALRLSPTRPALAGVCIGLLSLKPQLGLLMPVFLLAMGAWTTILAAAATCLTLFAFSAALFGLEPWHLYLTDTAALQWSYITKMTTTEFYPYHMTTPYAGLWLLGVPVGLALKLQGLIACGIIVATIAVARGPSPWPLKGAVLAFGTVMLMPYSLGHDLVVPLAALVWYLTECPRALSRAETIGLGVLWAVPFPLVFALPMLGIPLVPVLMMAAYVLLLRDAQLAHASDSANARLLARLLA